MEIIDTASSTALAATKVSTLATDLFYVCLKDCIDYNKPDPIARRQVESWKMNWSEGNCRQNDFAANTSCEEKANGTELVEWSPNHYIGGILVIHGDFVSVTLEMKCIWSDGDATKNNSIGEDGRLSYTCRLKSGQLIEKKDNEEKKERKIRKKMISRLREDSYISKLLGLEKENNSSTKLFLAQANIYVNANKFELEERVDVSQIAAEILRRSLWPSTTSSLDIVQVMLSLPSLPCRTTSRVATTTRLANRAKLRLLEDAMLDECEKEGENELISDLIISNPKGSSEGNHIEQADSNGPPTARKKKKSKR